LNVSQCRFADNEANLSIQRNLKKLIFTNALNEIFILFEVLRSAAPSIPNIPSIINIFLYHVKKKKKERKKNESNNNTSEISHVTNP